MKRTEKNQILEALTEKINNNSHFYLTDISDLNAAKTSELRRLCFKQKVEIIVVKNKLLEKAIDQSNKELKELKEVLKGHTSIMFCDEATVPAKLIKEFRKKNKKPILKAAYVQDGIFIGNDQLDVLMQIKSREELIADIVGLLMSPVRNVMGSLQSGANILTGVLETLSKREE
jgi:large subunit ribosomal protein L10